MGIGVSQAILTSSEPEAVEDNPKASLGYDKRNSDF